MGRTIFTTKPLEDLDWYKFQTRMFSLQCKMYEAMERHEISKVIRLQTLILLDPTSYCLALRAIVSLDARRVLPLATIKFLLANPRAFSRLVKEILIGSNTTLALGDLVVDTQVADFVWRLALEPSHDFVFSSTSYGLRPGRTCWDLQQDLISTLRVCQFESRYQKIFSAQVAIDPSSFNSRRVLSRVIIPSKYRGAFNRALKLRLQTRSFTHSNYLISLILHVALDGIDHVVHNRSDLGELFSPLMISKHVFRYANHVIFLLPFYDDEARLLGNLTDFLNVRGLQLKQYTVSVVDLRCGFTFLDWVFKSNHIGKISCYPTFNNCKLYVQKIKDTLRSTRYPIAKRFYMIASISREWIHYNRLCPLTVPRSAFTFLKTWCRSYLRSNTNIPSVVLEKYLVSAFG